MAKSGMEKWESHAEEHLPGGMYHQHTEDMEEAGRTIGEATNDRIESMFGMMDRRLNVAPASNPINVGNFTAAKNDKPVEWAKQNVNDIEGVCKVARTFAANERKRIGTRNNQLVRIYEVKKRRKDELITKRRLKRSESAKVQEERLNSMKTNLIRDVDSVDELSGLKLNEQSELWHLQLTSSLDESEAKKSLDSLKGFSSMRVVNRKDVLCKIIRENEHLQINNSHDSAESDNNAADSDGSCCTYDEETRANLVHS